MFINYLNDVVASRAYSRKLEEEADAVGLELMATAGYDPRAALDLWELMSCVEEDAVRSGRSSKSIEQMVGFLRTHPTSEARMRALEKDMEGAMRTWREHLPARPKAQSKSKAAETEAKGAAVSAAEGNEGGGSESQKVKPSAETRDDI
jgi:predicted Zn-dependent protease